MIAVRPIDDLHRSGLRPFDYYTNVYPGRAKLRHRGRVFVAGRDQGGTAGGAIDRRRRVILAPAPFVGREIRDRTTKKNARLGLAPQTGQEFEKAHGF